MGAFGEKKKLGLKSPNPKYGRIWVSPRANGGSIFQFELPTTANKD
jgi:hypothetical protein